MTEENHRDDGDEPVGDVATESTETIAGTSRLSRRQQRLAKVVALSIAIVIGLVVAEIALRLYWDPPEYSFFPRYALAQDEFTGARYAPNLRLRVSYFSGAGRPERRSRYRFTTNAMGFRSRELPAKKAPGRFRVLFVGDSFTEGFGVNDDETFPHYFEQIARRLELPVEVINAGQNATDFPEYVAFMRGYAKRLQPDLVVLSIYAGNDIPIEGPPNPPPRFGMSYGFRVSKPYINRIRSIRPGKVTAETRKEQWILVRNPESFLARCDRRLHRNSLLYRLTTEQLALRFGPVRGLLKSIGWIEVLPDKEPVVLGAAKAQMFLKAPQEDVERRTRQSLEQLREIKRICDDLDAPLFVQVIPYIPTLPRFEPLWDWLWPQWTDVWEERLGREPTTDDFDKDLPNRRVLEMVERVGLPYVDLTRLHRQAARFDEFHQLTFRARHGHFTPDENLYDAGVLLHELLSRGLLPSENAAPDQELVALELVWRRRHSDVWLPYFEPTTTTIHGARPIMDGFEAGGLVSSLDGIEAGPRVHVKDGLFSPVLDVQPGVPKVSLGDFIEYRLPLRETTGTGKRVVVVDVCRPATDERLNQAVRQSVWTGRREFWHSLVPTNPQGRWQTLELPLPALNDPTTLTIRVEATREFETAPSGEFPLLLRLRRLRVYEVDDAP